jgi:hypothetical protein
MLRAILDTQSVTSCTNLDARLGPRREADDEDEEGCPVCVMIGVCMVFLGMLVRGAEMTELNDGRQDAFVRPTQRTLGARPAPHLVQVSVIRSTTTTTSTYR